MARKTVFVSDLTGAAIEDGTAAQLVILEVVEVAQDGDALLAHAAEAPVDLRDPLCLPPPFLVG